MVKQAGALSYFGDARRAAVGIELLERNGERLAGDPQTCCDARWRAGVHRFLSASSASCREMLATLARSTLAASARRHIVVAQDTTEISFAGRVAQSPVRER
jgi:hypothetical protein